jgi:hypothetical protein
VKAQIERKEGKGRSGRKMCMRNEEDEMPTKENQKWKKRRCR